MDFISAVRALRDGLCEGIRRECRSLVIRKSTKNDDLVYPDGGGYIPASSSVLADDWQLVNPKPQTETVEVNHFAIYRNGYRILSDEMGVYNEGVKDGKAASAERIAELTDHIRADEQGIQIGVVDGLHARIAALEQERREFETADAVIRAICGELPDRPAVAATVQLVLNLAESLVATRGIRRQTAAEIIETMNELYSVCQGLDFVHQSQVTSSSYTIRVVETIDAIRAKYLTEGETE